VFGVNTGAAGLRKDETSSASPSERKGAHRFLIAVEEPGSGRGVGGRAEPDEDEGADEEELEEEKEEEEE